MLAKHLKSLKGRESYRRNLVQGAANLRQKALQASQEAARQQERARLLAGEADQLERNAATYAPPETPPELRAYAEFLMLCCSGDGLPATYATALRLNKPITMVRLSRMLNDCLSLGWIEPVPNKPGYYSVTGAELQALADFGELPDL